MNRLDPQFARQLQPGLKVMWFGRRAAAEIVAELSECFFRLWVWFALAWWARGIFIESTGRLADNLPYLSGVAIVGLLIMRKAIFEYMNWLSEVFVVTFDDVNGGGRVDKFHGWLRRAHVSEAVTPNSPTLIFDQIFIYRLWGWLTGEWMARITLKSVTHTFIEGRKISPNLERAIQIVRGSPKQKSEFSPTDLTRISELKQAAIDGLISWDKARQAAEVILARSVYGE